MKLECLNCGHKFSGSIELDSLGWHSSCPKCGSSFDVDEPCKKKKYRIKKGEKVCSLDELMSQEGVYWFDKYYHIGWFQNWTLTVANRIIKAGQVFKAVKEEVVDNGK